MKIAWELRPIDWVDNEKLTFILDQLPPLDRLYRRTRQMRRGGFTRTKLTRSSAAEMVNLEQESGTRLCPNAGLMLVHRLQRWPNVSPPSGQSLVYKEEARLEQTNLGTPDKNITFHTIRVKQEVNWVFCDQLTDNERFTLTMQCSAKDSL